MPQAFDGNRPTSTWNKNRIDPFYNYGELGQKGMAGLKQGEQAGMAALGFGTDAQKQSLAAYNAMAAGQGPSLATDMMRRQTAQSIAAQQSMQAQAGGAGAFRNAAWRGAAQQAAGNQAISELRSQEQQAAMQGAAGMASQLAGQGLQQQLGYAGMLNQAQISEMNAAANFALQQRALQEQERMGRYQRRMGWANFGINTAGNVASDIASMVSMSDERLKTNIAPGGGAASQLAGSLDPKAFDYMPGAGPPGNRVGVMAQQLEQTPQGASLVVDTPMGKGVDTDQAALAGLAISADQEQRLRALEQRAPAGMENALTMPARPAVMQPREVVGRNDLTSRQMNVDESLAARTGTAQMGDMMAQRVAEARDRLAQTDAMISQMRGQALASPDLGSVRPVADIGINALAQQRANLPTQEEMDKYGYQAVMSKGGPLDFKGKMLGGMMGGGGGGGGSGASGWSGGFSGGFGGF